MLISNVTVLLVIYPECESNSLSRVPAEILKSFLRILLMTLSVTLQFCSRCFPGDFTQPLH